MATGRQRPSQAPSFKTTELTSQATPGYLYMLSVSDCSCSKLSWLGSTYVFSYQVPPKTGFFSKRVNSQLPGTIIFSYNRNKTDRVSKSTRM